MSGYQVKPAPFNHSPFQLGAKNVLATKAHAERLPAET